MTDRFKCYSACVLWS